MRLFPICSSSKVLLLDCCQTQKTPNCQTQGKTGTISLRFLLHYTGYQSGIGLVLKSYKLLSKPLVALHHPTLKTSSHLMSPAAPCAPCAPLIHAAAARLISQGDWGFSACAPQLRHSLPEDLWSTGLVNSFKTLPRTHFYRMAFLK